jgi:hypothetical protein
LVDPDRFFCGLDPHARHVVWIEIEFDQHGPDSVGQMRERGVELGFGAHRKTFAAQAAGDLGKRGPIELGEARIHFSVEKLNMFSAIGRIIGDDDNQVEAEADGGVEFVDAPHHEATVASEEDDGLVGATNGGADCFGDTEANRAEVGSDDKALGVGDRQAAPDFGHEAATIGDKDAVLRQGLFQLFQGLHIIDAAFGSGGASDGVGGQGGDI